MHSIDDDPSLQPNISSNKPSYSDIKPYMTSFSSCDVKSEEEAKRVVFIKGSANSKVATNKVSTAKYNVLTFLPIFLFEQFRRWANIFFLLIALLQQIPHVSPTGRYTTLAPLIFILTLSAVKEIIEDIKRHRTDNEINQSQVLVFGKDDWVWCSWMNVKVGDIVKVINNNFFPADLVLLASSEDLGICFIETAYLDGETNLKIRNCLKTTSNLKNSSDLRDFCGTIECGIPSRQLYEFNGVIRIVDKSPEPLGPTQLLLRGSILRNTAWTIGLVVYTGHQTKLMMSYTSVPLKRSSVDILTNYQMLALFVILIVISLIASILSYYWSNNLKNHWYMDLEITAWNVFYNCLTFLILFNNLIPISLQVTLEVVRVFQAIFINLDLEMYDQETDTPAVARTSNLNEELGRVKYIFADKTGTLTRNVMKLRKCAIGDKVYNMEDLTNIQDHDDTDITNFLLLLSICHTVIPEKMPDGSIDFHAASPDEKALVDGACELGYIFQKRTHDMIEINAKGTILKYQILNVLEYTSNRKRMSVIVRDPNGEIKLLTKGADTVIYERRDPSDGSLYANILYQHVEDFSSSGLRTLCWAYSKITQGDYDIWKSFYDIASMIIISREEKMAEVADLIEKNLTLIGVTGIEDKLQDGVPDTITSFWQADINLWVLTGDAQATAINIGYACKLLNHDMKLIVLNAIFFKKALRIIMRYFHTYADTQDRDNTAMVIDGQTLEFALGTKLSPYFFKLCQSSKVVICCRVSPIQKAEVVNYVRKNTNSITLAIGDGSNDVAMIQRAHIGVGISGKEGMQAACAADYSIAQFKFLKRLLFVHGAWNYSRISKLILYSIYKNICFNIVQMWYEIYTGWSGQILFDSWSIGLYNVIFTALPPSAIGLFDRSCSHVQMMRYPNLYKQSQDGELFNMKVFWYWIAVGVMHSAILFWLPILVFKGDVLWESGLQSDNMILGNCIYTLIVVTVCLKAGLITSSWTWITHFSIWISIIIWFIFIICYSLTWPIVPFGESMSGIYTMLFTSNTFWFCFFCIPLITLLPDFTVKIIRRTIYKSLAATIRENEISGNGGSKYFWTKYSKPKLSTSVPKQLKT